MVKVMGEMVAGRKPKGLKGYCKNSRHFGEVPILAIKLVFFIGGN